MYRAFLTIERTKTLTLQLSDFFVILLSDTLPDMIKNKARAYSNPKLTTLKLLLIAIVFNRIE